METPHVRVFTRAFNDKDMLQSAYADCRRRAENMRLNVDRDGVFTVSTHPSCHVAILTIVPTPEPKT